MQEKRKKSLVPWIILLLSCAVVLYAGAELMLYCRNYAQEADLESELNQIRQGAAEAENEASAASFFQAGAEEGGKSDAERVYQRLKEKNEDYIAWLEVPGTEISYPLVQRDNSYYLNHDFKQEKSSHGSIFLDEGCGFDSFVWLIHGHHMKDGTMFGGLKAYEKKEFIETHRLITLEDRDGTVAYRVFAAALIDFTGEEETIFHYEELPVEAEDLQEYLRELKGHAYWYEDIAEKDWKMEKEIGEEIEKEIGKEAGEAQEKGIEKETDRTSGQEAGRSGGETPEILILSTCEYHTELERLIVVAKREL